MKALLHALVQCRCTPHDITMHHSLIKLDARPTTSPSCKVTESGKTNGEVLDSDADAAYYARWDDDWDDELPSAHHQPPTPAAGISSLWSEERAGVAAERRLTLAIVASTSFSC